MFDPADKPRIFALPPGADFPAALAQGLMDRAQTPLTLPRSQIIVNTARMQRRLRGIFDSGPAQLLPRISLLTALDDPSIPAAAPSLRRKLELVPLIARLLDQRQSTAARASIYDLADSLSSLLDEMQGEGVAPDVLEQLDITDLSGHWEQALGFIRIAKHFFDDTEDAPGIEARQRRVVQSLIARWQDTPPDHPIILAGSTGSRGTTHMLMRAIAQMPQGAVILPGFDFDMAARVWDQLDKGTLPEEDHPQYRFRKLMQELGVTPDDVTPWVPGAAPHPARNRMVSLALHPAPVTDSWLRDGPGLGDLIPATDGVTLLEAPTQRDEALAIAMRLRKAAEDGQTAALITPDRMLSRQVTATLDHWNLTPDDSAGQPLQLSPPGRFLRQVSRLFHQKTTLSGLLALLKHPLTHSASDRRQHLLWVRDLELYLRRKGIAFPDADILSKWVASEKQDGVQDWANWVAATCSNREMPGLASLFDRLCDHIDLAESIARGPTPDGSGELWQKAAGREALKTITKLQDHADVAGEISATDYGDLFGAILSQGEVRDRDAGHPGVLIWGTLEARVMGADLLILAGLNEGSWPEAPAQDPWLNRQMRAQVGLLLPERRIGLSAHDFQQAIGAPEVWLTRSKRSDEAETVPSRWVNRMLNLLGGLKDQNGPEAIKSMRDRGDEWLNRARLLEQVTPVTAAPRPSPRPPIAARPRQMSVTEIKRLIRDPYAIYAKHVLRLRPLDPLDRLPDALLRGIVIHEVLEHAIRPVVDGGPIPDWAAFMDIANRILRENVPWPAARIQWQARLESVVDWFLGTEVDRQSRARPAKLEARGKAILQDLGFTLTGTADRIDIDDQGRAYLYDYKTGAPPNKNVQAHFDKQLLLEAAMITQGGFDGLDPADVATADYIGLGRSPVVQPAPIDTETPEKVWEEFESLIRAYFDPDQGFLSRRALQKDADEADYDQLARYGEWDATDDATGEDVT